MCGYATEQEARDDLLDRTPARPAGASDTPPMIDDRRGCRARLTPEDLPAIAGWFEDPETRRFLGGPEWPAAMLANADALSARISVARGRPPRIIFSRSLTAFRSAVSIAARSIAAPSTAGEPGGPIILETIEAITGAIAFTIDPARRREGFAT